MISRFIRNFLVHIPYTHPLDRLRAQILIWTSAAAGGVAVLWGILYAVRQLQQSVPIGADIVYAVVAVVVSAVIYWLATTENMDAASWLLVGTTFLYAAIFTFTSNMSSDHYLPGPLAIVLTIPLVVATVLLGRRALFITAVAVMVAILVNVLQQSRITEVISFSPASQAFADMIILLGSLSAVSGLLWGIASRFQTHNQDMDIPAQRNWVNGLGMELVQATTELEMEDHALGILRERMPNMLIDWFLSDEGNTLTRKGMLGDSGRFQIGLNDNNLLAEAARTRKIVTVTRDDNTVRRSHLAASSSVAAAVPIGIDGNVVGVLDFQSSLPFPKDVLSIFEHIAEQISQALRHVRQVHTMRLGLIEQEETITRLQSQIQLTEQNRRQSISDVWSNFVAEQNRPVIGYSVDEQNTTPVPISELPTELKTQLESGKVQIKQQGNEQILYVPITLRDSNVGAMSFVVPADQLLGERQIEVARTVADRLALALENTRLFEQSQAQAQRERKANEIASLLIGATDVRLVLNLAAENFKDALGAVNTRIYIQPDMLTESQARSATEAVS
ncbi:MAG: GAF domain-containing protein [Anaerolineae bacterium]